VKDAEFEFEVLDEEAVAFRDEVLTLLVDQFGATRTDAIRWMNRQWRGMRIGGAHEILYHDEPERWAERIFRSFGERTGA
jgi:hypothetical protein